MKKYIIKVVISVIGEFILAIFYYGKQNYLKFV